MTQLIDRIREGVIGARRPLRTPFGLRPLVYADYTASGRALDFVEDYIREQVLPWYANTHTETNATGAQTTALREQARRQVHAAVNGSDQDQVIFCGAGATAAIDKLIDVLNLRLPADLDQRFEFQRQIPPAQRPVVFIGPYEHHSNELPWRESIADVVVIPLNGDGQIDRAALAQALRTHANRPCLLGSFSAASNVTGILSDVAAVTALLKDHGALAFWDYAAAAPYVAIDMQGQTPIDGVFISPHKFVGGPDTPGILVVKKSVLTNSIPTVVGGGTVTYVSPAQHCYSADPARREEAGTPAIIASIRAGLVFKLQREVGAAEIARRERRWVERALARLGVCPHIEVLGAVDVPRLAILSLRVTRGGRDLHYGFVAALLNDLFGIQVRGGCSCAGPYGHSLLGLDAASSRAIAAEVERGNTLLRPGWVRLSFNYFIDEEEFEYLLRALEMVAEHGWRLLPYYQYHPASGVWRYQGCPADRATDLEGWTFAGGGPGSRPLPEPPGLGQCLASATAVLTGPLEGRRFALELEAEAERLRWFVLPQDVAPASPGGRADSGRVPAAAESLVEVDQGE